MSRNKPEPRQISVLPLTSIAPRPQAKGTLRTVDLSDPKVLQKVEDFKRQYALSGFFIYPITVIDIRNNDAYEEDYMVNDGGHRFEAMRQLGVETCEVIIEEDTGLKQLLIDQINCNDTRVAQKPIQVRNALVDILTIDPSTTVEQLAHMTGRTVTDVNKILGLQRIQSEQIEQLILNSTICGGNAYSLAELPPEEQENYIEQASTKTIEEFKAIVDTRLKEIKAAAREGTKAAKATFVPVPKLRSMAEIKSIVDSPAGDMSTEFLAGLKFALSLDDATVAKKEQEWNDARDAREAKVKAAEADKEAKKERSKKAADLVKNFRKKLIEDETVFTEAVEKYSEDAE